MHVKFITGSTPRIKDQPEFEGCSIMTRTFQLLFTSRDIEWQHVLNRVAGKNQLNSTKCAGNVRKREKLR